MDDSFFVVLGLAALILVVLGPITFFLTLGARSRVSDLEQTVRRLEYRLRRFEEAPAEGRPATAATEAAPATPAEPVEVAAPPPAAAEVAEPIETLAEAAPPPAAPVETGTAPPAPARPSRSLEESFGTRWTVWVGGLALALGALLLVRYSIEAGLFGPAARVAFGLILAAALFYALTMLVTRRLARTDSTPAILLYTTGLSLVVSAALLPFGWRSPTSEDLLLFALLGLIAGGGNYFIIQAYRYAPAAVIAPFDYTALIWGTIIGWLIWHELPGPHVWLGVAILVASGLYIIHRETRLGRGQKKLDPIGID